MKTFHRVYLRAWKGIGQLERYVHCTSTCISWERGRGRTLRVVSFYRITFVAHISFAFSLCEVKGTKYKVKSIRNYSSIDRNFCCGSITRQTAAKILPRFLAKKMVSLENCARSRNQLKWMKAEDKPSN